MMPPEERPSVPRAARPALDPVKPPRNIPSPAILLLFLACFLPELLLFGADLGLWGNSGWRVWAWQHGGFWAGLLRNWRANYAAQPWLMFLTYGFLHGGPIHFAVNMLTLFSLAPPLVDRMGSWRFVMLYMVSLLGGAVGFALLSNSYQPMVGASGALFGLAGAHVGLSYRRLRRKGRSLRPVIRALLWLAGLNLVLWWAMHGMLAWQTHLGGFVAGWIVAVWLVRKKTWGLRPM